MSEKRKIRLADIDPPEHEVTLPSGRTIPVRPADAGAFELVMEVWDVAQGRRDPTPEDMRTLIRAVRRMLPDATTEEVDQLTAPMLLAVVQLGTGHAAEVYALLGESSAPGAQAPDSRRSSPATASPTSASG